MYFHKIPPAVNFRYCHENRALLVAPSSGYACMINDLGGNVFRYTVEASPWSQKSQAILETACFAAETSEAKLEINPCGGMDVYLGGQHLLASFPGREFGVLGQKWAMSFVYEPQMRFYGLGEKNDALEKSGGLYKFWNTDTIADFGTLRVEHQVTDPLYVSIPYLLIKRPKGCVGILLNNPYAAFMHLGAKESIENMLDTDTGERSIHLGAYNGTPEIYFIIGKDTRAVTRQLQRLCGLTPLPPLWALGYHQSRWGYRGLDDLEDLDRLFDQWDIPCDGLWLDIDYMDAYKVFTVNSDEFENYPERLQTLHDNGRRIVPILDPGVKYDRGFDLYTQGETDGIFCRTSEGETYSGFVWPGRTAFPDFSMEHARDWWAQRLEDFTRRYGFDGYWLDMNDPSTASSELEDMRFNNGSDPHESYHNQYACGMQQASRQGLLKQPGNKRPFLLSRSGSAGSSRFAAIWTGDNWSNYFHLKASIAMSLNLSLSGVPFNGPDVPGFEGDATPELAADWCKACFLFPFFRNHAAMNTQHQEPWRFSEPYRSAIIHYIRLRYKVLPYLYHLFIEHARTGDPILRPLFYDFNEPDGSLDETGDQFMVGPAIMQAPIVAEQATTREVRLPGNDSWLDAGNGGWLSAGRDISVETHPGSTALFFREGSIVPMQNGLPTRRSQSLDDIECHLFLRAEKPSTAYWRYAHDDGESINAEQSVLELKATCDGDTLVLEVIKYIDKHDGLSVRFVCYDAFSAIRFNHGKKTQMLPIMNESVRFTDKAFSTMHTQAVRIASRARKDRSLEPCEL